MSHHRPNLDDPQGRPFVDRAARALAAPLALAAVLHARARAEQHRADTLLLESLQDPRTKNVGGRIVSKFDNDAGASCRLNQLAQLFVVS